MTTYDNAMTHAGSDSIGAEGSFPNVAAQAVQNIAAKNPSPFYGYIRSGVHQKVYLFPRHEDVTNWFSHHTQLEPGHDYAAVFASPDLRAPVPGMEHFNTRVSGDQVGTWALPLIALPLGALAGYYYSKWRETHQGKIIPFIQGDPYVGGWGGHVGSQVGGPWHEMVGAEALAIAKPIAIPVLDEDGNLTATFVRWFPTQDQISQFGGNQPQFYVDAKGGSFIYNDPRGKPSDVGPYLSTPFKIKALSYKPTWEVQFIEPSGELTDRQTAYKKAQAIYGVAYTAEQLKAEQERMFQDLFGQRASVGAQAQDDVQRRAEWPQTRALIQSATDAVTEAASMTPAAAYVWHLDAPDRNPYAGSMPGSAIVLEPTSLIEAFNTQAQALARLRELALTRPIALAMFERSNPHWPNPTAWRKSSDPADAPLIAQYVASRQGSTQMSGTYMGADPVASTAIAAVRHRAEQLADRRAGNVVGVIHTPKDNLWHTLAFRNEDDADDWLDLAAQTPASFTYAAYFNKNAPQWPRAVIEKISGMRSPPGTGLSRRSAAVVGAALDDNRARGKQLATRRKGRAAGAIRAADGLWHVYGFTSLDDAVDWLQSMTREKSKFIYAAAYEKGGDGSAFIQDEEFGSVGPARTVSGRAA